MNASSNGGPSPWCSSDQKCTDSIYCNRFQIIFWAFIQIAIKPEICFAMIYSSIVFHIVHAFNYYKFSALQLHQYKWFILCNQIIVTNNLICYCYMYIFSHNKCHQAEFQFFIFWRTSCRLESSGWLAFPKRLWLGKWRHRRACGELTMVHKSSKEFLCGATRDAGSWSNFIHLSHCSCHSLIHFFSFQLRIPFFWPTRAGPSWDPKGFTFLSRPSKCAPGSPVAGGGRVAGGDSGYLHGWSPNRAPPCPPPAQAAHQQAAAATGQRPPPPPTHHPVVPTHRQHGGL